jgi:hypothetical protein
MGCIAGLVENIADSVCRDPSFVGCNSSTLNLGTVSFTSGSEITIVGDNISQIWSRPVTATGCNKTTFNGGSSYSGETYTAYSENADCRNNPGYPGDLFTGCAVIKYASQICPYPWRVPTANDYDKLVRALGGKMGESSLTFIVDKFEGIWKGERAGEASNEGLFNADCMIYKLASATPSLLGYVKAHPGICDKNMENLYHIGYSATLMGMFIRCVREN